MSDEPNTVSEYDGIEEYDNSLPNWWLGTLWTTGLFGMGYWAYYHTFGVGESTAEAFEAQIVAAREAEAARPKAVVSEETLGRATENPDKVAAGKESYALYCAACHGPGGGGLTGPNLTDDAWLYGGGLSDIYAIVKDGSAAKGMPAWGPILGEKVVGELVAFLGSIRDTHVAGREAQGVPRGEKVLNPADAGAP